MIKIHSEMHSCPEIVKLLIQLNTFLKITGSTVLPGRKQLTLFLGSKLEESTGLL